MEEDRLWTVFLGMFRWCTFCCWATGRCWPLVGCGWCCFLSRIGRWHSLSRCCRSLNWRGESVGFRSVCVHVSVRACRSACERASRRACERASRRACVCMCASSTFWMCLLSPIRFSGCTVASPPPHISWSFFISIKLFRWVGREREREREGGGGPRKIPWCSQSLKHIALELMRGHLVFVILGKTYPGLGIATCTLYIVEGSAHIIYLTFVQNKFWLVGCYFFWNIRSLIRPLDCKNNNLFATALFI